MKQQVKTHFKDEIRRVLIVHALAPIGVLVAIFLIGLALLWNHSMIRLAGQECESLTALLQQEGTAYLRMTEQMAARVDLDRWDAHPDERVAFNTEVYDFLNAQRVRGSFYLMDEAGDVLFSTAHDPMLRKTSAEQLQWFLTRIAEAGERQPRLRYCRYPFLNGARSDLQMAQTIIDRDGNVRGYLAFVLSEEDFAPLITSRPVGVVVTNRYGHIFLSNTTQFHTEMNNLVPQAHHANGYFSYAGGRYFVRQKQALDGDLQVLAAADCSGMVRILSLMALLSVAILLGVSASVFSSASTISKRKTRIIDEIVEAFLDAKEGKLENHLQISTNDEFEIIGETYNTMLDSLRELMDRNEQQAQQTALATIQQLESQFNPHFLYNTLETVRFMIRLDAQAAERMIVDLSKLLRYSVRYTVSSVTVAQDVENTQNYLRILKYRFGERFHYSIRIPEQLQDCRVPKLIFQPIIENAVKYGMEGQERIRVTLELFEEADGLLAVIRDDGAGIPETKLSELRELLKSPQNRSEHIGLYNVHRRLILLYGEAFGLQVESGGAGRGTVVSLRLAIDRAEAKEEGEDGC